MTWHDACALAMESYAVTLCTMLAPGVPLCPFDDRLRRGVLDRKINQILERLGVVSPLLRCALGLPILGTNEPVLRTRLTAVQTRIRAGSSAASALMSP